MIVELEYIIIAILSAFASYCWHNVLTPHGAIFNVLKINMISYFHPETKPMKKNIFTYGILFCDKCFAMHLFIIGWCYLSISEDNYNVFNFFLIFTIPTLISIITKWTESN